MQPAGQENRGGARPGAGRKKKTPSEWSDQLKREMVSTLKKKSKEQGYKNISEWYITDMMTTTHPTARAGYWKQIMDQVLVKETKATVDTQGGVKFIALAELDAEPEGPTDNG